MQDVNSGRGQARSRTINNCCCRSQYLVPLAGTSSWNCLYLKVGRLGGMATGVDGGDDVVTESLLIKVFNCSVIGR